jgi:hypothetical protein
MKKTASPILPPNPAGACPPAAYRLLLDIRGPKHILQFDFRPELPSHHPPAPEKRQRMKTETASGSSPCLSWLAVALVCFLVPRCASVPEGSAAMKEQALSFTPPPGQAGIYVIRPSQMLGGAVLDKISLDYQEFGVLGTASYLFATVPPGRHSFRTSLGAGSMEVVPFTVEAGKNYYFHVKASLVANTILIEPISETDGRAYVRKFKIIGENRF